MTVTRKLIGYNILVHSCIVALIWLGSFPAWAIVTMEGLLVFSFLSGWRWIRIIDKQQDLITSSIENLKSRDFAIQLRETGHQEFDGLVKVYNQMIENLRNERVAANELNYFLASIIRASPSGIVLFDYDDNIKAVNPAAEQLLEEKQEGLLGKGKKDLPLAMATILYYTRHEWKVVQREVNKVIRVYCGRFMNRGFETRFVLFEDFSREMYETEKASWESIVRMMGHEVNNTTGAVNSVLDTYIGNHDDNFSTTFQIIKDRNNNLGLFMRKLSDMVRLPRPDLLHINIVPVIRQSMVLVKAKFKNRTITWELDRPDGEFYVRADQPQMEQVFINVLTNAAEAISGEGRVEVTYDQKHHELLIRNNGEPLSEENTKKVFTSFFTTKTNGMGVGLMLTREILKNHGCQFYLKTMEAGITEFGITFSPR